MVTVILRASHQGQRNFVARCVTRLIIEDDWPLDPPFSAVRAIRLNMEYEVSQPSLIPAHMTTPLPCSSSFLPFHVQSQRRSNDSVPSIACPNSVESAPSIASAKITSQYRGCHNGGCHLTIAKARSNSKEPPKKYVTQSSCTIAS